MKTSDIVKIIVGLILVVGAWKLAAFLIGKLLFWGLIAGGAYVGYKLLVSNSKQIEK